jgi:hypothetical protein
MTTAFLVLAGKQTGRAWFGSFLEPTALLMVNVLSPGKGEEREGAPCNLRSMFNGGKRTLASTVSSCLEAEVGVCAKGRSRRNGFDPDIWRAWYNHGSSFCLNKRRSSKLGILLIIRRLT